MKKNRKVRYLDFCINAVNYFKDSIDRADRIYIISKQTELSQEDKDFLQESANNIHNMYELLREFKVHAKRFETVTAPKSQEKEKPVRNVRNVNNEFMRLKQVLHVVPFSAATLWRKSKVGEFPAPIKLSANITAWRTEDVNDWIESIGEEQ